GDVDQGQRHERSDDEPQPFRGSPHGHLLRNSRVALRPTRTGRIIPYAGVIRLRASSRSFTFWILPELVIGKSSTKTMWRGILKLAIRPLHCPSTSPSVSAWPGSRCTKATPTSDRRVSGELTTAA